MSNQQTWAVLIGLVGIIVPVCLALVRHAINVERRIATLENSVGAHLTIVAEIHSTTQEIAELLRGAPEVSHDPVP